MWDEEKVNNELKTYMTKGFKDAVCQPANVCRRKVFNVPLNASFVPMKLKTLGTFLSLAIKHKKSGNMLDFWSRELPWSSV